MLFYARSNPNKGSLLHVAVRSDLPGRLKMIEFLINSGVDINAIEFKQKEKFFLHYKQLSSWGYWLVGPPLFSAISFHRPDAVKLLLKLGADTSITEVNGRKPIEYAHEVFEATSSYQKVPQDNTSASLSGRIVGSDMCPLGDPRRRTLSLLAAGVAKTEEIVALLEAHAKKVTLTDGLSTSDIDLSIANADVMWIQSRL